MPNKAKPSEVKPSEAKPGEAKLEIKSDLKELKRVRAFIREYCEKIPGFLIDGKRIDRIKIDRIELAITEVTANIIKHAYRGHTDGRIQIHAGISGNKMVLKFYDWGKGFKPSLVPLPKFDGSKDHGFGFYIISQSVDEVIYSRDEKGRNSTYLKIIL